MHFPDLCFFLSSLNLHATYLKFLKYQDQQIYKRQMRKAGKPAADSKLTDHCCLTIQSGYWTLSKWMNETDSRISKEGHPTALSLKSCKRVGIQPMMHPCSKGMLLNTELFSVEKTGNCKENWRPSLSLPKFLVLLHHFHNARDPWRMALASKVCWHQLSTDAEELCHLLLLQLHYCCSDGGCCIAHHP